MRTIYATLLEFEPAEGQDLRELEKDVWTRLGKWILDHKKREEGDEEWVLLGEDPLASASGALPTTDGHSLKVHQPFLDDEEGPLYRELEWSAPLEGHPGVFQRVEAVVYRTGDAVMLTFLHRLHGTSFVVSPVRYQIQAPSLITEFLSMPGVTVAGEPAAPEAQEARPGFGVYPLFERITDDQRRLPLVVVSKPRGESEPIVDPDRLAKGLAGIASVVVLANDWASDELRGWIGRKFSCFGGAVRVFWPGFSEKDSAWFHRAFLPGFIKEFFGGVEAFEAYLIRMVGDASAFLWTEPDELARLRLREREIEHAKLKEMVQKEKGSEISAQEVEEVLLENDRLLQEVAELQKKVRVLERKHISFSSMEYYAGMKKGEEGAPEFRSVEDVVEWASTNMEHLEFLETAFKSAKDSPYVNLDYLNNLFISMDSVAKVINEYQSKGRSIGVDIRGLFNSTPFEYKPHISQTARTKHRHHYEYEYNGEKVLFEPHITIGGKQPDKCLSVHMIWDREKGKFVIAHVGRHKPTAQD